MDILKRKEIANILLSGDKSLHSHLIIYLDRFDYSFDMRFVSIDEDVEEVIARLTSDSAHNMISIIEVYNYALNLEAQLHEQKPYHIEPKPVRTFKNMSEEAKDFASYMHRDQYRKDGTEFISHPIHVAEYVKDYKTSKHIDTLIACSYLHDTIEDTTTSYYDLVVLFGPEIANIVLELTTDEELKNLVGKSEYLKMRMTNMSSWALTLKLCDRLDNVSDLDERDEKFRAKYTKETLEILSHLLKNRRMSDTQIRIITDILTKIKSQTRLKPEEDSMLGEIIIPDRHIALTSPTFQA